MEGIGSEVSHKIRAAIKAKLIELGAYVDDELPDYIMVMVANKRTRTQMDDDLQLFLGTNTKVFTSWLHTVLQKLQEVTVANFDNKKPEGKKSNKRKHSISDVGSSHSSEEAPKPGKKHSKKHKENKKSKKNKHKSRDKSKPKTSGKKLASDAEVTINSIRDSKSSEKAGKSDKKVKDKKNSKEKKLQLNEAVGKAILGNLKKNERLRLEKTSLESKLGVELDTESFKEDDTLEKSDIVVVSSVKESNRSKTAAPSENKEATDLGRNQKKSNSKINPVEDDFNIEPLKPTEEKSQATPPDNTEKSDNVNNECNKGRSSEFELQKAPMTISAPTKELLKQHDKLLSQAEEAVTTDKVIEKPKEKTDSDGSMSPEAIRRQLLLSRAKKKLEESKRADRMKSTSPEIMILEETKVSNRPVGTEKPTLLKPRSPLPEPQPQPMSPPKRDRSRSPVGVKNLCPVVQSRDAFHSRSSTSSRKSTGSSPRRKVEISQTKMTIVRGLDDDDDVRKVEIIKKLVYPMALSREEELKILNKRGGNIERKKNIISISESLEMEKKLGVDKKAMTDFKKSKEKGSASSKKPVPSRIVTIPEPEVPDIPSIVKVKPREYISREKQANKALILKAVADAEKSIATVHNRSDNDQDIKKPEALFTKNLRGKRFEKLAVTLSNVRNSPDSRDRTRRMVSLDSDNSDALDLKADSLHDSELSGSAKRKAEATPKKIPNKSDDQFISSKTTLMEKNEKYIHCWLEGVQKAVKDEEIVNPNEIEDVIEHSSDEEKDTGDNEGKKKTKNSTSETVKGDDGKGPKSTEKDIGSARLTSNRPNQDDGPQIVVTLDGLSSKTLKDIRLKNREGNFTPILTNSNSKKPSERDAEIKSSSKNNDSSTKAGTSGVQLKRTTESKRYGFEKISDRFGRINKTNENHVYKDKYLEFERDRLDKKSQVGEKERHLEKIKDKIPSTGESKNKQLIAQLSEKFGKVDREFDNKKRKYVNEDRRYSYGPRRGERDDIGRDLKYKKIERKSLREVATDYEDFRRVRSKERCMYWPDCSKGNSCEYHHPTSPSKLLPNSKNKERTRCKDDQHCHDRNCPYEHSSDKFRKTTPPKGARKNSPPPSKYSTSNLLCKFFPSCKNLDCRYFHPKKCRYNDDCNNPDCKYLHTPAKRTWSFQM